MSCIDYAANNFASNVGAAISDFSAGILTGPVVSSKLQASKVVFIASMDICSTDYIDCCLGG